MEIWKQRRSTGMRSVEDNARAHIHFDVINYLTEESINIMAYSAARCAV